jgi:hypothetical protein
MQEIAQKPIEQLAWSRIGAGCVSRLGRSGSCA